MAGGLSPEPTAERPAEPAAEPRPIRFSAGPGRLRDRAALVADAQLIERSGYATLMLADHFMIPFAPLIALQAVADATRTLRVGQTVLNQDLRHPAVLAKELATLDVLSGGRLEIGLGAGWMRDEYEQAGISFDTAATRIDRLEEVITVLKGLLGEGRFSFAGKHFTITDLDGTPKPVQRPHPPILVGGGGRKLLSLAGRQADIVQIMPRTIGAPPSDTARPFTAEAYAEKIGWVREAAGDRFAGIELGTLLLNVTITDDPDAGFETFFERFAARLGPGADLPAARRELRSSPVVAIGTPDEVCAKLLQTRDRLGISYFSAPVGSS
jgi:probable F420-dependent oxidoreductase